MIEVDHVSRSFGGVPVLRDVTFSVPPGTTLGIAGENGAGKSTLMNIIGGNLLPDSGSMRWGGQTYTPRTPRDARARGIAFIHQELNLFPNLTVAENIWLTSFPRRAGLIHRRRLQDHTQRWLNEVGLTVAPGTPVERLSAGERQLVEVAKALSTEARLIIFDEPTTSLGAREAERLFELLRVLRERGISIIYISHKLPDLMRLADNILVLRDGAVAGTGRQSDFTVDRLIALMVGRNLDQLYPARSGAPGDEPLLEVRGLTRRGVLRDINFTLLRGELLGISGLLGAGRSEMARVLFGLDALDTGQVILNGKDLGCQPPRARIDRGLAFLTENRREEGLCLEASISDNISLVALRRHTRSPFGLLRFRSIAESVRQIREAVRLSSSASDRQPTRTLSGGNQQKVVLAKWLLARPEALILDEPTRGVDVGARFEIYQLVHRLADAGTGVLVLSSDLEELTGICDRILVMCHGEIRDELRRGDFNRERIMAAAIGARKGGGS